MNYGNIIGTKELSLKKLVRNKMNVSKWFGQEGVITFA